MTHKKSPVREAKNHSPFGLRKAMVFVGVVAGLIVWKISQNIFLGMCVHLTVTALMDQLAHYGFHLKASQFSDPQKLLLKEEITPEKLDRHYAAKCHIRLISLVLATLSQMIFVSPELFLGLFATTTLIGRFYAWYHLDIVGPKILHMRDLTEKEMIELQEWQEKDSADLSLGFSTGMGPYGNLQPKW